MQPLTDPPPIEPKCLSSIESLSRYLVEHVDAVHQPTDDGHRVEDLPNPPEPALRLNAVTRLRHTSSSSASAHIHADDGLVVLLNRLPAKHTGPLTGQLNLILGESFRAKKRLLLSHGTAQYVRVVEELDGGGDLEENNNHKAYITTLCGETPSHLPDVPVVGRPAESPAAVALRPRPRSC